MPVIQCEHISLSFPDKIIFDKLNLHVEKGEHACLSGVSGVGKTTLLKMLAGYVIPDSGTVRINNLLLDTTTVRQIRKSMIWIPQNIHLPVENGLQLMKLLHVSSRLAPVQGFLQELGLEKDIIGQHFKEISGGEKQRIVIAVCLSFNKEIILMDEPTSSLDEEAVEMLIRTIQSLEGRTVVAASHHPAWVQSADQIVRL